MKISTKGYKLRNKFIEHVFADNVLIGVMKRTGTSIRAFYMQNNVELYLGEFNGDIGRRDAKTAIIERNKLKEINVYPAFK